MRLASAMYKNQVKFMLQQDLKQVGKTTSAERQLYMHLVQQEYI